MLAMFIALTSYLNMHWPNIDAGLSGLSTFLSRVGPWITSSMTSIKDYTAVIQSIVTTLGIIVGAIWALRILLKRRQEKPKIRLTHSIYAAVINRRLRLLRVTLRMENLGSVLVRLGTVDTWLERIKPWPTGWNEKKRPNELGYFNWPAVKGKTQRHITPKKVQIEPNELEEFYFDFVLPRSVTAFVVVSFLDNPENPDIGWRLSTIYDIPIEEAARGRRSS